ncbi:MAG: diguanylate cyclase [Magnetococcales bacterium]|nr:diguanylate cyclase [Magnetococcales bacterium]
MTVLSHVSITNELMTDLIDATLISLVLAGFNVLYLIRPLKLVVKSLQESETKFRLVIDNTAEGIMLTDNKLKITFVNPAFTEITGYKPPDVLGRTPSILSSGQQTADFYREMWQSITNSGHWRGDIWNRRKDGEVYVQRLTISTIYNEIGDPTNFIGMLSDVTIEKRATLAMAHQAAHDPLTKLPNRMLLLDRLESAIQKSRREESQIAVLFIDLDGFKAVNDTHGHLAGDCLLVEVTRRLSECVRRSDTVARIGGDEFVIMLLDSNAPHDPETVSRRILQSLVQPISLDNDVNAFVGASIGIALLRGEQDTPDSLIAAADTAMYKAKKSGKGRYHFAESPIQPPCPPPLSSFPESGQ